MWLTLDLLSKNQIILIRGNHEDLALELLHNWHLRSYNRYYHHTNGTIDTVCQLTGNTFVTITSDCEKVGRDFMQNPYIQLTITKPNIIFLRMDGFPVHPSASVPM